MELGVREVFIEGVADPTRMARVPRGAIFVDEVETLSCDKSPR